MGKALYIAEKPSVAREFAKALGVSTKSYDGYLESSEAVITWCVGHLVTMSYPEVYDPKLKKWSMDTLPFLPEKFLYQVIDSSAKQFKIVAGLLNRKDVDIIYVCTDSGREGEYIYRLVEQEAKVQGKERRRVWIDSQTEEEILRGIREAKDLSAYDNLAASAYLRAKEDYLMGINFSRILALRYGSSMAAFLHQRYCKVSVGRVMTCALGMVVRREREIRDFVKTPFYRVLADVGIGDATLAMEWKAVLGSKYEGSPLLYKENGFKERSSAEALIASLPAEGQIAKVEKKSEKKNAPMLYNLAELQNDCSKLFKISPDETLNLVQELYEKKLVTYPRTDARVLSTAVAKEIDKNIKGLCQISVLQPFAEAILAGDAYKKIAKTKYTNDKQITDHYAIIPTGQGIAAMKSLKPTAVKVYEIICRRFLAIFMAPAVYEKLNLSVQVDTEFFFATEKYLKTPGYLEVMNYTFTKKNPAKVGSPSGSADSTSGADEGAEDEAINAGVDMAAIMAKVKKGDAVAVTGYNIKEGETSPPKRYNSGAMILAMENAGQLIEDEDLRAQIKGSGIGTSATRAEILKKLVNNEYLALNKKTQIYTPTLLGEMLFDVVRCSIPSLLNPELTASWEKGLTYVAEGSITEKEYMDKLESFVTSKVVRVKDQGNPGQLRALYEKSAGYYR